MTTLGLQTSQAGDITTVDSVTDQPASDTTTLREAIEISNDFSGVAIEFDSNVFSEPQTIVHEQGELLISSEVSINGPGTDLLTINGNDQIRIFTISMSGLTLTGGKWL